jgi:hypothetical protein
MKSNLQIQKEKKYYSKLNENMIKSIKIKINEGGELNDDDFKSIKGPDRDKVIEYLLLYYNNNRNKNKGIIF